MSRDELTKKIDAFIDAHRAASLWHLRHDFYPRTPEEQLRTLDAIQAHCTLDVYRRAGALKEWLLPSSNETSVAS